MTTRVHQCRVSWVCLVLGIGFVVSLAGCSRGEKLPPTYPVSGTVLYKDQPVEGATVVFRASHEGKARVATGMTDAQGHFQLSTFGEKDGAIEGTHTVTVAKMKSDQTESASLSMEEAAEQKDAPEPKVKSELPTRYASPTQTDLKAEVTAAGPNEVKLELKD